MKKLLSALPLLLLLIMVAPSTYGQCAGGGSHTLANLLPATLQACGASVNTDGTTIILPAGTQAYTGTSTPVNISFANSVVIQGAGAISATTGGASLTGTDQTILLQHMSNNRPMIIINTTAGKSLRITGIAFLEDSGSTTAEFGGSIAFFGKSSALRLDHVHFFINLNGSKGPFFGGSNTGVMDHFYVNGSQALTNNVVFENGATWNADNGGFGNGSWADGDHWGTSQFMFLEDGQMQFGYPWDCVEGGRFVVRYSTLLGITGTVAHGTHDEFRGCRAEEVYNNTMTPNTTNPSLAHPLDGGIMTTNSGTALVWGNSVDGFKNITKLAYYRINGQPYGTSPAPPLGFGMCGAVTGGPSVWDQNIGANGYACLDLPGRGQGDLLTNEVTSFSDILNSTTSTRIWPHEVLTPVYTWNNTLTGGGLGVISNTVPILTDNIDYYNQFGPLANAGSFNGTIGVGSGLLAARPATCTAGPGGNTPGVGYWATNATNSQDANHPGVLYVCNPTNTWTVYYQPYTYPNPLTGGSVGVPSIGFSLNPLAFGNQNINTSSSLNETLTNSGSATQTYSAITVSPSVFVNGNTGLAGQCPASGTIAVGASCVVKVTFTPIAVQSYSGTLSMIGTVSPSISITGAGTSSISTPAVPTGLTASVIGTNVTLNWTASTGTPTGYNVLRATVSGGPYTLIATLGLATSYADNNRPNGSYFYVVNAFNTAGTSANSTQASAVVATSCGINLSPASLNVGTSTIGTIVFSGFSFTVTNVGTASCTGVSVANPSGPNGADFGQSNGCSSTMAVNATCSITPNFTPSIAGLEQAAIVVSSSDPTGPDTVLISGTGQAAVILSPPTITMSNTYTTKTSATAVLNYTNQSGVTITISSIVFSTGDAAIFSTTNDCGGSVLTGVTCHINITFTPTSNGNKITNLIITDSAGGSPRTIVVTGSAKGHHILKVGVAI